MRYVFVSDIHGCYDKLMEALNAVKFNKKKDTLVSVGDPFDRGNQNKEVLEFLMSCPNRILILGNHDARLKEVLDGNKAFQADVQNGILNTLEDFTGLSEKLGIQVLVNALKNDSKPKRTYKMLQQYFNECVAAAEWNNLIATHGWLPHMIYGNAETKNAVLVKDWRNCTDYPSWINAMWANSENCMRDNAYPDKPLLIGHWHAWRLARANGLNRVNGIFIDASTFEIPNKLIAIDGCSNYPCGGIINTYVFEADDSPITYKINLDY